MDSINSINYKITKLFQNPNINFFIIMILVLLISCYTFINMSLKYMISSFVSNQVVILFILIFVILIGFYNINIAILVLLFLFIIIYGTSIFSNSNMSVKNKIEGFTDDNDDESDSENENDSDSDDEGEIEIKKTKSPKEIYDEQTDETVSNIKNTLLGSLNSYKEAGDNEYKKSLLENKQIQFQNEKKINKKRMNNSNSRNNFSSNSKTNSKKEKFQTVKTRSFDPSKEEDTNFLITKEILQDMVNRIDYNFESSRYLKKYLKHRIEEIVDMNKLLDDDYDD